MSEMTLLLWGFFLPVFILLFSPWSLQAGYKKLAITATPLILETTPQLPRLSYCFWEFLGSPPAILGTLIKPMALATSRFVNVHEI